MKTNNGFSQYKLLNFVVKLSSDNKESFTDNIKRIISSAFLSRMFMFIPLSLIINFITKIGHACLEGIFPVLDYVLNTGDLSPGYFYFVTVLVLSKLKK